MSDLTVPEARDKRNSLASRTDVLDKVGVLATLPGDMHTTTEMVASFYGVDVELVRYHVKANREELDTDGYRVLTRSVFESEFGSLSNLDPRARTIALFPRRAVLRVGMLLRDSSVARRVRDYLLDSEQRIQSMNVEPLTGLEYALRLVDAEKRVLEAQARAEMGEKFKRAIEGGDGLTLREFHKKYFSAITETAFMEHLYSKGYLINQIGKGAVRTEGPKAGTRRDGTQHRHPTYKGKRFFYLHGGGIHGGKRREGTRVRPGHWELELRDQLAAEGLAANENTAGLFVIEGGNSKGLA
ncbi:hypothetical protein QM787_03865 [Rhodococcus ruber]|nr:hypothetical protein [Rhodococcus ruber]MCD2127637.1 hypothetical protein [Rhodococcus ruber]MCZ4620954.1 hypothetical protein [Rhodococcus ruber]MDI9966978.1 hypothetical protein [Rhodococcus ruber]MDI9980971.1 hypothetical protein [Rhodococcus ruber]MDI9985777.1 hypothetical protein [Rhodococcus ruber]